ncbi:MAG TPA: histidine kinase [Vicinamibacterales bacterium]|nr:histidine kinase [Vicinamibacterales bacterium]
MHPILGDRRRLFLLLVAWALVGGVLALLLRTLLFVPWRPALLFALPLALVAAPVSLSAWYLCRAMPLARTSAVRVAITALLAALVTASLWAAAGRAWWQVLMRLDMAERPTSASALTSLVVGLGALAYLLSVTVHYLLQAFEESAAAARKALEADVAHREAELRALRAQVDPHFLFNSLNSISGLIVPDPERARLMCQLLADFLRDSLKLGGSRRIPLAREVGLAEQYLHVEQVRFGPRLEVQTPVATDCADVPVPPLILQPLVENAVRHGIATRLEGGVVEIAAYRAGERAVLVVRNPRDAEGSRRGTGFGVDIVRRRLGASFGERASLAIEASPESYRVSVTLPVEEAAAT